MNHQLILINSPPQTHAESQSDNAKPQMPQKKKKTTSGGNALYRLQLEQEAALYKRQERLAYLDDEAEEEDEDMAEGGRAIGTCRICVRIVNV